jgi:hypothetical protein
MPTPTVISSGNFVRPFNGSDQDSSDQESHRLVIVIRTKEYIVVYSPYAGDVEAQKP